MAVAVGLWHGRGLRPLRPDLLLAALALQPTSPPPRLRLYLLLLARLLLPRLLLLAPLLLLLPCSRRPPLRPCPSRGDLLALLPVSIPALLPA